MLGTNDNFSGEIFYVLTCTSNTYFVLCVSEDQLSNVRKNTKRPPPFLKQSILPMRHISDFLPVDNSCALDIIFCAR